MHRGRLLDDFSVPAETDWNSAVLQTLKSATLEKIRTPTRDGFTIEPIYTGRKNAEPVTGRRIDGPWTIVQRIDHTTVKSSRDQVFVDLDGGAGGLELVFASSPFARGYGLNAQDAKSIFDLLDGVLLDLITLRIDAGDSTVPLGAIVHDIARERRLDPARLSIALVSDPVASLCAFGQSASNVDDRIRSTVAMAADMVRASAVGTAFEADGRVVHGAGGTDVQELAAVLAAATTYWRALVAGGIDAGAAAGLIGFTVAVDQDQFRGIAKIRALRKLWARAQAAAAIEPRPARIHAETAWRSMSRLAPHTNLVRTTLAAFAAGVGGADSVTVLPFTAACGLPDGFARRLARNTQSILIEESNLWRVADPAAGSGLVEAETDALARGAWGLFQEIEAEGGLLAAVRSGSWQARVAAVAADRAKAIARRKEPLTGVSEFPDIGELPVAVLDAAPVSRPALPAAETVTAMPERRLSEPFEALRAAAAAARPKVFLANLGRIADFNARSTWAKNLFEAGGIEAVTNDGFESLDALVAAFRAAGTPMACLCSTDAVYAAEAAAAAAALKAAGAGRLYLAGKPADTDAEARYTAAGVDGFVHVGMDVVATLEAARNSLGIG